MWSDRRHWLVGIGVVVISSALSLLAPAPAHAVGDCYTVTVGPQSTQVCP